MGVEIERKFLVRKDRLPARLPRAKSWNRATWAPTPTVRVRLVTGRDGPVTRS